MTMAYVSAEVDLYRLGLKYDRYCRAVSCRGKYDKEC